MRRQAGCGARGSDRKQAGESQTSISPCLYRIYNLLAPVVCDSAASRGPSRANARIGLTGIPRRRSGPPRAATADGQKGTGRQRGGLGRKVLLFVVRWPYAGTVEATAVNHEVAHEH